MVYTSNLFTVPIDQSYSNNNDKAIKQEDDEAEYVQISQNEINNYMKLLNLRRNSSISYEKFNEDFFRLDKKDSIINTEKISKVFSDNWKFSISKLKEQSNIDLINKFHCLSPNPKSYKITEFLNEKSKVSSSAYTNRSNLNSNIINNAEFKGKSLKF